MAQRPMYQQIAEDLRAQIESGVLRRAPSCRPSSSCAIATTPRGTPSGTR